MTAPGTPLQRAAYRLRSMSAHDLALVQAWQMAPHVQEWWDDDPIMPADEDEPALDQYIVAVEGRPFAYLQCYLQSAYPENGLGAHPAGTRGIDQFIGAPDMVGRSHGSAFIRAFADGLLAAGVQRAIADPSLGMQVQFQRLPNAIGILQALQYYPGGPLMFAARALVAAAAAGAFYWRFKLPFALLPLAASLVVAAIGVASFIVPQAAAVSNTVVLLLCGLGVFAAAMSFDASDRERLTRRADCAFWLHLLAAPLIVHSVISLVSSPLAGAIGRPAGPLTPYMNAELALAVAIIVAVLAVVAVLIDRRALLVSGLAYLGGAIGYALAGSGPRSDPSFVVAATLVILGAFVLTLGAGWVPLRRLLLGLVPPAITNHLPPVPARP